MSQLCFQYDVVIIGSGAAGLTAALQLPDSLKVGILSKSSSQEGSTYYAQGGVAAVWDTNDSVKSHVEDTLVAGAGLCHKDVVRFTVEMSAEVLSWLVKEGVPFTQDESKAFHLTQEGGHSHRRILHAADATGQAIHNTLLEKAKTRDNISFHENLFAIDLIREPSQPKSQSRCAGFYAYDPQTDNVVAFQSKVVILATGGASKVYRYTTNPDVASGDGIAMAWRAGCRVANMEFNQFHPTCLYHLKARSFLLTEAIRGEGGYLKLPNGERFMTEHHPKAELAPRDIVARAIDYEMKKHGLEHVYLDISHKPAEFVKSHFPTIYEKLKTLGLDLTKEPIPIVPAAHYTCGGVVTDKQARTDIPGLYVIGEAAFTGLHGANRMASNSLLECLVFAHSAAKDITSKPLDEFSHYEFPAWDDTQVSDSDEAVVITHNWEEVRRVMWDYVGIVRSNKRLARAKSRIELLQHEIDEYYSNFKVSQDLLELRNLVTVANLIVRSAMRRKESRGLHYNVDHQEMLNEAKDTVLQPRLR